MKAEKKYASSTEKRVLGMWSSKNAEGEFYCYVNAEMLDALQGVSLNDALRFKIWESKNNPNAPDATLFNRGPKPAYAKTSAPKNVKAAVAASSSSDEDDVL